MKTEQLNTTDIWMYSSHRAILIDLSKQSKLGKGPGAIQTLSIATLGAGECQELAALTIVNLFQRGIKDCVLIGMSGTKPGESGEIYRHTFVLLAHKDECPLDEMCKAYYFQ
jgi:hypothetical protein